MMSSSLVDVTTGEVSVSPVHSGQKIGSYTRGWNSQLTVSLAQVPLWVYLENSLERLFSERSCTAEQESDGAQVIFAAQLDVAEHLNDDGRYDGHLLDAEFLNSFEERLEFESGHHH
jgi:hypothetical protein